MEQAATFGMRASEGAATTASRQPIRRLGQVGAAGGAVHQLAATVASRVVAAGDGGGADEGASMIGRIDRQPAHLGVDRPALLLHPSDERAWASTAESVAFCPSTRCCPLRRGAPSTPGRRRSAAPPPWVRGRAAAHHGTHWAGPMRATRPHGLTPRVSTTAIRPRTRMSLTQAMLLRYSTSVTPSRRLRWVTVTPCATLAHPGLLGLGQQLGGVVDGVKHQRLGDQVPRRQTRRRRAACPPSSRTSNHDAISWKSSASGPGGNVAHASWRS